MKRSKISRKSRSLPFPEKAKTGYVWSMTVNGTFDTACTAFEADREGFSDPYARSFARRARKVKSGRSGFYCRPVMEPEFDWLGDRPLHIYEDHCCTGAGHVRGADKAYLLRHGAPEVEPSEGCGLKIPYLERTGDYHWLELLPVGGIPGRS